VTFGFFRKTVADEYSVTTGTLKDKTIQADKYELPDIEVGWVIWTFPAPRRRGDTEKAKQF